MLTQQPLDVLPLWLVFILSVGLALLFAELGFQLGLAWQRRAPDKDTAIGAMVGAILALLAFLLAFLTAEASNRYDARRQLVLDEANAIGTAYLQAGYLPEPVSSESRRFLREYVDLRLTPITPENFAGLLARSNEIQDELWRRAETLVRETGGSDVYALYVESLTDIISLHRNRVIAGVYARIPATLLLGAYAIAMVIMFVLGFANSYDNKRSLLALVILVLVFCLVLFLIVDLDRSREGLLQVSQQPLIDLQLRLNP
jgi:hypothetical protein